MVLGVGILFLDKQKQREKNSRRCGINDKGDKDESEHTTRIELKQRREGMLSIAE